MTLAAQIAVAVLALSALRFAWDVYFSIEEPDMFVTHDGTPVRCFGFETCDGTHVRVWASDEVQAVATFQDSHEYKARGWCRGMFVLEKEGTDVSSQSVGR